jgi:NAD(P)-dependent dehydrogenase (short-subunit alcohol dehydrogenase family)
MGELDGRTVIVTGASRGIGEEIARLFAREGARVVFAARTLNEGDHRLLSGSLSGKASGKDPISFFADLLRNEEAPLDLRFQAAKELAPFVHPKLASVEARIGGQTHEDRLAASHAFARGGWGTLKASGIIEGAAFSASGRL